MSHLSPDPSVSTCPAQQAGPCPGPEPAHPPPGPSTSPLPSAPEPHLPPDSRSDGGTPDSTPTSAQDLPAEPPPPAPPRGSRVRARRASPPPALTAAQRLLVLDAWRRSGLPAGDFAPPGRHRETYSVRLETQVRPGRPGRLWKLAY